VCLPKFLCWKHIPLSGSVGKWDLWRWLGHSGLMNGLMLL
jgi:hypothetical protein